MMELSTEKKTRTQAPRSGKNPAATAAPVIVWEINVGIKCLKKPSVFIACNAFSHIPGRERHR